jgi:hypothetical protein
MSETCPFLRGAGYNCRMRRLFQRLLNPTSCAIWCSLPGLIVGAWLFDSKSADGVVSASYAGAFVGAILGFTAAMVINRFRGADLAK